MSKDPSNASVTSLQSTTTAISTSPLNNAKPPPKDYSIAFATLQSRYGTTGHIPTPKPDKSKISKPQTSSSSNTFTSNSTLPVPITVSPPSDSVEPVKNPGLSNKKKGLLQTLKGKIKGGS